jgi:pimeloyl-ACP methyl ester carboxylesterase
MLKVAIAPGFRRRLLAATIALLTLGWVTGDARAWGLRRYFAELDDPGRSPVRLFVEERGEGTPIVLVHGLGGSTYAWRKMAPGLAASHRVIAIDLKGFGRSAKPDDSRYRLRDQALLLGRFLEAKDLSAVTLVGYSLGGSVVLALLVGRESGVDRVQRVVLIDSPAFPQEWPAISELLSTPVAAELTMAVAPPELLVELAFSQSLKSPSAVTAADVSAYARPLQTEPGRRALRETLTHLMATDFAVAARAYPRISQPTLVLWCRDDPLVPLRSGQLLARSLANATLRIDDGCGHVPLEETPARLTARILEFAR